MPSRTVLPTSTSAIVLGGLSTFLLSGRTSFLAHYEVVMAADSLVGPNLNPNSVLRLYMASNEKVAIRLFAQVWAPRPMMGVDDDNIVRTTVRPNTKRKIILGDVAQHF